MIKKDKCIQILIADDHEIVRYGIAALLEQHDDMVVVAESSSCEDTLMLVSKLEPNIILLDLTLKDGNSLACIAEIKKSSPNCNVLVYTASTEKHIHIEALRYGAAGVFLKELPIQLLCKAIRNIHFHNEMWVDKVLTAEMWKQNIQSTNPSEIQADNNPGSHSDHFPLNILTPRENQIARLSSKGLTAKQIGEKLFISDKTVRNQLTVVYRKLDVKNQLELSINCHLLED